MSRESLLSGFVTKTQLHRLDLTKDSIWLPKQRFDKAVQMCILIGAFLSPDPKRIGGYSDQPGVRPSVRLSVRLSVRRQKLVRSITFIPFEIF